MASGHSKKKSNRSINIEAENLEHLKNPTKKNKSAMVSIIV